MVVVLEGRSGSSMAVVSWVGEDGRVGGPGSLLLGYLRDDVR